MAYGSGLDAGGFAFWCVLRSCAIFPAVLGYGGEHWVYLQAILALGQVP